MGYKRIIRKIAKFILAEQPKSFIFIKVAQINYGGILKGKNIVITGGGRGLGYYMAKNVLAKEPMSLFLVEMKKL